MIELNPWGNELVKDYEILFKDFGLQRISEEMRNKLRDSHNFRRDIVFAHRDFDKWLAAAERGEKVAIMTGIKPSSEFHLGSKLTADEIIYLQKKFKAKVFYCIADEEAYFDNGIPLEQSHTIAVDNVADLLALGLDYRNAFVYKQSECLNVLRLGNSFSRKITLNTLEAIYGHQNLGLYTAALIQAGDILQPQLEEFGGPKHVLVPVGIDQDPHIRLTRDIAVKFQEEYGFIPPSATYHRFFRALNGETKMSKREPMSVLTLNDSPELVEKKVKNIFTGGRATAEEQRKLGAETWKCVWFELMKFHFLEDDDDLKEMYEDSVKGRILCGECKEKYLERLQGFLEMHQKKKKKMFAKAERLLEECESIALRTRTKVGKKS